MKYFCYFGLGVLVLAIVFIRPSRADYQQCESKQFTVYPIGHVKKEDDRTTIILDKKYEPGLLGLDGFSHVYVLYWFDRNDTPEKRSILQVHPRGDAKNPLSGVFATRAPTPVRT